MSVKKPRLLQGEIHLLTFVELDSQHFFASAGKVAFHRSGLSRRIGCGGHLHAQKMFSRRDLYRVKFVTLDVVEDHQAFLFGSLQFMRKAQAAIDPDREIGLRKFVVHFDFEHRGRGFGLP